ncbi:MAG: FHA domain-containing protein [Pirellulaceae bacterium]|jgi:predicted component of type VI protein secretion system|nr:FHA domain-containing protein [Pirellulaceae bacterium]MDP6553167.1 FHA domain-containing protein [Pirellulaceae bacterium]MDP6721803.1 FHA domain-containing protein [Pirellulaceae bacterium]
MDVTLVVVGGETRTSEVKLSLPTVIGRGRECKLRLPQPLVSRRHCELFERDGRLLVRDLGSMNGTYVGSERIGEVELPQEGLLTVGAVTFRALYDPSDPISLDEATHHDFGAETKSDVETPQSVEIAGPMDPVEIDRFEQFRDHHNDLTQPASPPVEADEPTVDAVDVALPPVVGKAAKNADRPD